MKIFGKKVALRPAVISDRRYIFDIGVKIEILNFLGSFNNSYEKFAEDYNGIYFTGEFNEICGGVMICIEEDPVGFISYGQICFGQNGLKPGVMELDIWMDGERNCGKGLGTDAIVCLSDFLHDMYQINTFFMVPSKMNPRAIKSYRKSGFVETSANEKQKVLESIFISEYLSSLDEDDDYLSDKNCFMVKEYLLF
jgi:RimJ/RimL family protein N-acetyltransferase